MDFEVKENKQKKIKKYTKSSIMTIIAIFTIFLIFEIGIVMSGNYNFKIFNINLNFMYIINNYTTILTIQIICSIILIVIICIISHSYIDKLEWKYIKNYLYLTDNYSVLHLKLKDEIIEGNLMTEGCIKKKNKYMIDLPKYKCSIKRFDEQKLMGYVEVYKSETRILKKRINYSLPDFKFFTIDSVIEYIFELLYEIEYAPFLYEKLRKNFNDISILDNKIIIRYHLYDNSIDESKYEHFDPFYSYDFTENVKKNNDDDNIINVVEGAKKIFLTINNEIKEKNDYGNEI